MKSRLRARGTFYKYLFSYILILSLSLAGVFYIVNLQLKGEFHQTYLNQNEAELNSRVEVITGRLLELNKVYYSLQSDIATILARYDDSPVARISAVGEMNKYISGSSLIRDVLYMDTVKESVLSTSLYAQALEGEIAITIERRRFRLPLGELGSSDDTNRLLRLEQEGESLYLYVPQQNRIQYQVAFVLEEKELRALLQACLSHAVRAVALVDGDNSIIYGLQTEIIREGLEEVGWDNVAHSALTPEGLALYPSVSRDIGVLVYADLGVLEQTVSTVFQSSYYIMFLIAVGGLVLTMFSMRLTYNPILAVIQKITGRPKAETDNLQSIVAAFDDSRTERDRLLEKVERYRISIQRSLMDSVVQREELTDDDMLARIDQLFAPDQDNCIFAAVLRYPHPLAGSSLPDHMKRQLPRGDVVFVLEQAEDSLKVLLNFPGPQPPEEKEEALRRFLEEYCGAYGCRAAVSDSSSNPLDIARLYGNAEQAARFLGDSSLVLFQDLDTDPEAYPYVILDTLSDCLEENDFDGASGALEALLASLDWDQSPEFFVRCVLIDTITVLIGTMNRANIRFEKFSADYFQALYLCRSSDYRETGGEIRAILAELLDLYAQESESGVIQLSQIRLYVQENALSSDFSVATLADAFHTSAAYMSFFFKKKTNANITDYVWQLRLDRAKELLEGTDTPIDRISGLVGYDNASSFRRKFKEAVGMSPSQFRREARLSLGEKQSSGAE